MNHAIELGYLEIEVPAPDPLAAFLTDVVGLAPGDPTPDGAPTWTDDDAVHRIIVTQGPRNDLATLGFEAIDEVAFTATLHRLAAAGYIVADCDAASARRRRVRRLASVDAPWGGTVEVALGLGRWAAPAPTPLVPGGFLTAGQGLGHAVVATTAFDESVRFVTDGLGMVQSDWLETEIADGIKLEVRFFHCNARHHSLALARAPIELPQALHHVMVETNDSDDVGRAYDRVHAAGLPLPSGLGRHDNDRMFSFYVASPAGFEVEIGHGARQITTPWTDDRRYDRISAWGHQPVTTTPTVAPDTGPSDP
jgi:2,3-dihydroxybiphenyl 1,2-dioxygenase